MSRFIYSGTRLPVGERFLLTGIALIFQALFFLSSGGCSREQSSDQTVGVVQAITDEEIEQWQSGRQFEDPWPDSYVQRKV